MWQQLDSGRVTHRFEWVVLVATLAIIPVMVIELEASSSGAREVAFVANWLIWAIFVAELAFILTVAPRKAAALKAHWLDVTIIVVTAPAFGRLLASLRLVRLVRLLRLLRLTAIVTRTVQRERAATSGATFRFVRVSGRTRRVARGRPQPARSHRRRSASARCLGRGRGAWTRTRCITTRPGGCRTCSAARGRLEGLHELGNSFRRRQRRTGRAT
jgi:hypothetical protein